MKKLISLISALAICTLSLTGCNRSRDKFEGLELVKWGSGDRRVYEDLDDLEESAAVAVVGTFIDDAEQQTEYRYNEVFGKEILTSVCSYNTIEVTRVLMGDVNVGDKLKIRQGYGVVDNKLITTSDLTPMMKGDTWVFFLKTSDDIDYYWYTGDSYGRYPLSGETYAEIAVTENEQTGVYFGREFGKGLHQQIIEKYNV